MDPTLGTGTPILSILQELEAREPLFHRPEFGTTRADFERMTESSFWEVGASGQRYDRDYVLSELEKRYAGEFHDDWQTRDFACAEIAEGSYLVTYTLVQDSRRVTRRSTIWRRTGDGWKALYHQGTLVTRS